MIQEGKRYGIFGARTAGDFDVYFDKNRATRTNQIYRQADGEIALSTGNLRIAGRLERVAYQLSLRRVYVGEVRPLKVGEVRKSIPINSMPNGDGSWAVTYALSFFGLEDDMESCEILVELLQHDFVVDAGTNGHLVVDHIGDEQEVSRPGDFFRRIETTLRWQLAEMSETICTHGNNCFECTVDNCELPLLAVLMGSYAKVT